MKKRLQKKRQKIIDEAISRGWQIYPYYYNHKCYTFIYPTGEMSARGISWKELLFLTKRSKQCKLKHRVG